MKGRLTQLQLIAIIGFVAIALLGGGGYYYVLTLQQSAQDDLNAKISQRNAFLRSAIPPSEDNIKILQNDIEVLSASTAALAARLKSTDNHLQNVEQKNPIIFKQDLVTEQLTLRNSAKAKSVQIPANFAFGFSRYNNATPLDRDTVFLGKQLIGIHELLTQLFDSQVSRLLVVRRTFDEAAGLRFGEMAGGSGGSTEWLRGKTVSVGKGIYTIYPFELEFIGKPVALRTFLNKLTTSPYIFIVRYLQINSTKLEAVHLENLARESSATLGLDPSVPVTTTNRPPTYAMGFEEIQVVVRVDMIDWNGHAEPEEHATAGARTP